MESHNTRESRDFADKVPGLVENEETAAESAQPPRANPGVPSTDSAQEVYDRSAILARDGKVIAGWGLRFIVVVIAAYIAFQLLSYIWVGLLPVILALIIATFLWPPTRWLRNLGVPAALAALLSIVVFLALFIGVFAAMAPTVGCHRVFSVEALASRVPTRRANTSHTTSRPSGMNHQVPTGSWLSTLTSSTGTPKLANHVYAPSAPASASDS